jgi:hypothetical protein
MAKKNPTPSDLERQKLMKRLDPVFKLCNVISKEYAAKEYAVRKEITALDKKIEKLSKGLGPVDLYSSSWGEDDPRYFLVSRKDHLEDLAGSYGNASSYLSANPKKDEWPSLADIAEDVSFYALDELEATEKAEAEHAKKAAKAKKG